MWTTRCWWKPKRMTFGFVASTCAPASVACSRPSTPMRYLVLPRTCWVRSHLQEEVCHHRLPPIAPSDYVTSCPHFLQGASGALAGWIASMCSSWAPWRCRVTRATVSCVQPCKRSVWRWRQAQAGGCLDVTPVSQGVMAPVAPGLEGTHYI